MPEPAWMGSAHVLGKRALLVEAGNTVQLVDLRTRRARILDWRSCAAVPAAGLGLLYAGEAHSTCLGVRAYGSDGRLRLDVLGSLKIESVQVSGSYAYARPVSPPLAPWWTSDVYVIELATRRVVNRVQPSRPLLVVTP